jgi:hypothetical protein
MVLGRKVKNRVMSCCSSFACFLRFLRKIGNPLLECSVKLSEKTFPGLSDWLAFVVCYSREWTPTVGGTVVIILANLVPSCITIDL